MTLVNFAHFFVKLPGGYRLWWGLIAPLLRRFKIETLAQVGNVKMLLNIGLELDFQYAMSRYDIDEIEFIVGNSEPDSAILDVGANQGLYSLLLAHKLPRARILAFEPDPRNIRKMQNNISLNGLGNITIRLTQRFEFLVKKRGEHLPMIYIEVAEISRPSGGSPHVEDPRKRS